MNTVPAERIARVKTITKSTTRGYACFTMEDEAGRPREYRISYSGPRSFGRLPIVCLERKFGLAFFTLRKCEVKAPQGVSEMCEALVKILIKDDYFLAIEGKSLATIYDTLLALAGLQREKPKIWPAAALPRPWLINES